MSKKILWALVFGMVYASTGASFIDNGFAARSESMGAAFTAVADDLDAFYYNPAGFAWQKGTRFNSYVTKINNLQNDFYAGLGSKLGDFYLAVNLQNSSLSDIPVTEYDGSNVIETGNFFDYRSSAMNFSVAFALGNYLPEKLSLGLNVKILSEKLYHQSAAGSGLDLGLMYLLNDNLKLGFAAVNLLQPKMVWNSGHEDVVARNFRFGASYLFGQTFLFAVDLVANENERYSNLGLEYLVNDFLSLRAGMMRSYYSFGLGVMINNFNFDYSLSQPYDELREATHKFAVGYFWGERLEIKPQTALENNYNIDIDNVDNYYNNYDNQNNFDNVDEAVTDNAVTGNNEEKPEEKVVEIQEVACVIDKVDDSIDYKVNDKDNFKLLKKTVLLTDGKVKGFYKIENLGNDLMDIKITVKVLDGQTLIGEKSMVYKLPAQKQNVYSIIAELNKVATKYKVKSFIQVNKTQTESYLDYLE